MSKRRTSPRQRSSGRDPEEALFSRMSPSLSKSSKVAIMKSRGMVKQVGRHLEPTSKGRKAISKLRRGA